MNDSLQAQAPSVPTEQAETPVPVLDEPVLDDDYPVYGDYLYVADGTVICSHWHDITVRQLKRALGVKEVRRCDIFGRREAATKAAEAGQ